MSQTNINTIALHNFINQVRAADVGHQREIKLDIVTAKQLSHTLSLVMVRLAGNYEGLIGEIQSTDNQIETVQLDGGNWSST
jgi:hypothetical protein